MREKKTTIYQIASRAQVSVSTVSRVLNDSAQVASDKRDRVLAVMKELDYQPNALARGLTAKQTNTIGLIIPDILNPYYTSFVYEIEREAIAKGYTLLLCNTMHSASSDAKNLECMYMHMLSDKRVDGAIVIGGSVDACFPDEQFSKSLQRMASRMPIVIAGQGFAHIKCPHIYADKTYGVRQMVHHLYDVGHRSMGFVMGREDVEQTSACTSAFLETTRELEIFVDPAWILGNDYTLESGRIATETILSGASRPSALFAINDMVAIGCLYACKRAGLTIPTDIAIAGCDNTEHARYTTPTLTTIDMHIPWIARESVDKLVKRIRGEDCSFACALAPKLILRTSSGYKP